MKNFKIYLTILVRLISFNDKVVLCGEVGAQTNYHLLANNKLLDENLQGLKKKSDLRDPGLHNHINHVSANAAEGDSKSIDAFQDIGALTGQEAESLRENSNAARQEMGSDFVPGVSMKKQHSPNSDSLTNSNNSSNNNNNSSNTANSGFGGTSSSGSKNTSDIFNTDKQPINDYKENGSGRFNIPVTNTTDLAQNKLKVTVGGDDNTKTTEEMAADKASALQKINQDYQNKAVAQGALDSSKFNGFSNEASQNIANYAEHLSVIKQNFIDSGLSTVEAERAIEELRKDGKHLLDTYGRSILEDRGQYVTNMLGQTKITDPNELSSVDSTVLDAAAEINRQNETQQAKNEEYLAKSLSNVVEEDKKLSQRIEENLQTAQVLEKKAQDLSKKTIAYKYLDNKNKPNLIKNNSEVSRRLKQSANAYSTIVDEDVPSLLRNPTIKELNLQNSRFDNTLQKNKEVVQEWIQSNEEKRRVENEAREQRIKEMEEQEMHEQQSRATQESEGSVAYNYKHEPADLKAQERKESEEKEQKHLDELQQKSQGNVFRNGGTEEEAKEAAMDTVAAEKQRLDQQKKDNFEEAMEELDGQFEDYEEQTKAAQEIAHNHMGDFKLPYSKNMDELFSRKEDEANNQAEKAYQESLDEVEKYEIVEAIGDDVTSYKLEDSVLKFPLKSKVHDVPVTEEEQEILNNEMITKEAVRNTITAADNNNGETGLDEITTPKGTLNVGENFDKIDIVKGQVMLSPLEYEKAKAKGLNISGYKRVINEDGTKDYVYDINNMTYKLKSPGEESKGTGGDTISNGTEVVDIEGADSLGLEQAFLTGSKGYGDFAKSYSKPVLNDAMQVSSENISLEEADKYHEKQDKIHSLNNSSVSTVKGQEDQQLGFFRSAFGLKETVNPEKKSREIASNELRASQEGASEEINFNIADKKEDGASILDEFLNAVKEEMSQSNGGQGMSQSSGGQGMSQSSGGQGMSQSSGGQGMSQSNGGQGMSQSSGGQGMSQSSGESSGQSNGESSGQSSGESSGQSSGESSGQSSGESSGQSSGESSGQSSGGYGMSQSSGVTDLTRIEDEARFQQSMLEQAYEQGKTASDLINEAVSKGESSKGGFGFDLSQFGSLTTSLQKRIQSLLRPEENDEAAKTFNNLLRSAGFLAQFAGIPVPQLLDLLEKVTSPEAQKGVQLISDIISNPTETTEFLDSFKNDPMVRKFSGDLNREQGDKLFRGVTQIIADSMGIPNPFTSSILSILTIPDRKPRTPAEMSGLDDRKTVRDFKGPDRVHKLRGAIVNSLNPLKSSTNTSLGGTTAVSAPPTVPLAAPALPVPTIPSQFNNNTGNNGGFTPFQQFPSYPSQVTSNGQYGGYNYPTNYNPMQANPMITTRS